MHFPSLVKMAREAYEDMLILGIEHEIAQYEAHKWLIETCLDNGLIACPDTLPANWA